MKAAPRPVEQRASENARFTKNLHDAGIICMHVLVPIVRAPELRALAAEWRDEARLLLEEDLPTADQILQIHGVCRALEVPLPLQAFTTRAAASSWLARHEKKLGPRHVRLPRIRKDA